MSKIILEDFWQHNEKVAKALDANFVEIAEDLQQLKSEVQKEPVEMRSCAWQSERVAWARSTHLFSPRRIQMFNFTLYPRCRYAAPIFASDFVIIGGKLRIGVIDAMPLFPENDAYNTDWLEPFSNLYQESLDLADVYERKLDWSFRYLGKYACLATGTSKEAMPDFMSLWQRYLQTYLGILHRCSIAKVETQVATKDWFEDYNSAHLVVENKRNPLLHYFGEHVGRRYNAEFLFNNQHIVV